MPVWGRWVLTPEEAYGFYPAVSRFLPTDSVAMGLSVGSRVRQQYRGPRSPRKYHALCRRTLSVWVERWHAGVLILISHPRPALARHRPTGSVVMRLRVGLASVPMARPVSPVVLPQVSVRMFTDSVHRA